ncbi:MAG: hypothetical protein GX591_15990 [Planctomycetes bacterium]|nr:hypothetical protein [Planctomycetota bacterium]
MQSTVVEADAVVNTAHVCSPARSFRPVAPRVRLAAALLLAAVVPAITGCPPAQPTTRTYISPAEPLAADVLAGRLGLNLHRANAFTIDLRGYGRSLLIMGPPNPSVLVDGHPLDPGNGIVRQDSQLWVKPALAERIARQLGPVRRPQPALVQVDPLPPARPVRPVQRTAVVVLDAGHGGDDPGAPNEWGPPEKIVVMDTVHHIADALRPYGVRLILTRSDDTFVELDDRVAIANDARADLFVSVHADSHPSKAIDGFTLYIAPGASPQTAQLANSITRAMEPHVGTFRGIRDNQRFRVLVNTRMPAVLVELGYLTHPAEAARLSTTAYRRQLAGAIAEGIVAYLRGS